MDYMAIAEQALDRLGDVIVEPEDMENIEEEAATLVIDALNDASCPREESQRIVGIIRARYSFA